MNRRRRRTLGLQILGSVPIGIAAGFCVYMAIANARERLGEDATATNQVIAVIWWSAWAAALAYIAYRIARSLGHRGS